ncbi:threonine--tRNA ligase [Amycolatopsis nalaikhensis]|uniref:Threonine--tRNA ligase n=1 Tax=Amycolatopsis nalaikhensis TaxID=715472 RepID=A0ABY8XWF1_9PSEU|nr:threonine--tRNA ligase [Amycolatopsis sp. 2-2]WIV59976.1 threonine--tRNA ligase [Amycolatopsis sp. 2-2]
MSPARGGCPGLRLVVTRLAVHEESTMHDHRKLGRELGLFDTDPLIGAGLPYWLPDGAAVRHSLEEYVRRLERRSGYRHVNSPVLGKRDLYEISGHWAHYRDDMYPPMDVGGEQLVLRPSLCPHHALIYRSRGRSHRELPLRIAELGGMYRAELSGVLGGLSRVRAIHLNDAHIFCTLDQVEAEVAAALAMIRQAYDALGISPARYRLSLPGDGGKYVAGNWDRAADILRSALDGLPYDAVEGEAAFYGPKIDVQIVDSAGRESTLSTVQVDFHQPEQFDLEYIGPDAAKHRPVMVHRSIIGSVERAVAQLVEVHGGAFPGWLAPVQLRLLPVSEAEVPYAREILNRCGDVRAEIVAQGSLGARIRDGRLVPFQAVIGREEVAAGQLSVRLRDGSRVDAQPAEDALASIREAVRVP